MQKLLWTFLFILLAQYPMAQYENLHRGMSFPAFMTAKPEVTVKDLNLYTPFVEKSELMPGVPCEIVYAFGEGGLQSVAYRSSNAAKAELFPRPLSNLEAFQLYHDAAIKLTNSMVKELGTPIRLLDDIQPNIQSADDYPKAQYIAEWDYFGNKIRMMIRHWQDLDHAHDAPNAPAFQVDEPKSAPENYVTLLVSYEATDDPGKNVLPTRRLPRPFWIGMQPIEFAAVFTHFYPNGYDHSGTVTQTGTIGGVKGNWNYEFENNALKSVRFESNEGYETEGLSNERFALYNAAAKMLIAQFSESNGNPIVLKDLSDKSVADFLRNPYAHIIEAEWDSNGFHRKVLSRILGGGKTPIEGMVLEVVMD
jgi:hypothetical protein